MPGKLICRWIISILTSKSSRASIRGRRANFAMNPINNKLPEARTLPQPFKQQAGRMNQFKPTVAQLKNAVSAQSVKSPVAPPVYHPQVKSAAAQAKTTGATQMKPPPTPAVYRPQPVPKVLQAKTAIGQPRLGSNQSSRPAIVP